ncbi:MAG: PqqD family protein [Acidobacteriota bacterium]
MFRRAPHTAWRQVDDETILVDLAGHRMLGLDAVGGALWHHLDAPRTLDALIEHVVESTAKGAPKDAVAGHGIPGRESVGRFLEQLVALGVLEIEGRDPSSESVEPTPRSGSPEPDGAGPRILWQEEIAQVAASCAFLPGQNALCNSAPFS